MKKRIIAMALSVAMMLTMFPTGVLADDFDYDEGNTAGVTVSAEGQSDENQGEGSDTAQVNVVEGEGTQPETVQPENDQTEPEQNETDQAKPDQTETNQTEQAGTQPDNKQPEPEQPATDPAENGVSDGAESTEGEQAESKTEFTVTWESEGETILTKTFAEGTSKDEVENAQPAEDPVKEADGDVAYEFAGWTPDYADVTADQTYTATFEEASQQDEQDEMLNTASLVEPAAVKGSAIVAVGDTAKLTGSGESYSYRWHSWITSAPEIATVSMNDNGYQATVTGVKTGTATITHTWFGHSETFTVEVKETEPAIVYYLKSPKSDPNSNENSEWGTTPYGTAEVNVASAPCDDGKNVFNPSQYVRSYSDGTTVTVDGVKRCRVTKETTVWNEIFDAYKQQIENQFNSGENGNQSTGNRLTITKDDVEYIDLVPYKISKNNGTNPDKHLDCTVVVKCNKIVTAKFWVIMPDGQPKQAYAENFRIGDSLSAPTLSDTAYPGTRGYNGKTYVLNRDTWYTDPACTNAATLPTTITADGEYQYYVQYKLLQTDISKLTVNAPADVTYNGKPQEQKPVVKDGDKVLKEGTDYTLSYSEDTTNVGTVTVTVTGKGNYSGETTVTYQIKPKAVTVKAENKSKVYGADDPNLTATVTGNLNGDVIAYTLSRKAGENVGTYTITPKGEEVQGNYTVTYKTGQLEITPAESLVVKITGNSESKPYTGENQSVTGYKTNAPEDVKVALKADKKAEATGKDVGKYPMNLKAKDFEATEHKNYKSVTFEIVKDGQLEITPVTAKVTVTITGNTDTVTYDGEEHTVTGYEMKASNAKYTAADMKFAGTAEAKGTNAATYQMGLEKSQFSNISKNFTNVEFVVTDGSLTIAPNAEKVTVTITGNTDTVTYDGEEHTVTGYKMTASNAKYTAADMKFAGSAEAKGTNAATYQMGLEKSQFSNISKNFTNVEFVVTDGSLTIAPNAEKVTVTITGNTDTVTYDGKEHTVTGYKMTASNAKYTAADMKFAGSAEAKGTNAATYQMGLEKSQFSNISKNFTNVEFVVTDGSLTIAPNAEKVTVTITGNTDTVTYDGEEHTVTGYKVTEISNEQYTASDFTFTGNDTAKGTDVGTYNMGLKAEDFQNTSTNFANVTFVVATDGQLEITPVTDEVTVTITGNTDTVTYDGKEHTVTGYKVTEISNNLYKASDIKFNGTATASRTDVGTTNMGLKADQFQNTNGNFKKVTFKVTDGSQTITAIDAEVVVTIAGKTATATYDGKEHTVTGYEVTEISNNLYKASDIKFNGTAKASRTDVGTTNMGLKAEQFENTNGNFKKVTFKVTDGSQTITAIDAEVVVTIAGKTATATYDGKEHTVTGYEVTEISNNLYKASDIKFNGTAKASRTDVGTTNMGLKAEQFENTNGNFKKVTFKVTDGSQTITAIDAEVVVTIAGKTATATYDGKEHTVTGYEVTEISNNLYKASDIKFNGTAKASRTDVGTTNMGLKAEQFENTNGNFKKVTFKVTDGSQTITAIDAEVVVTIAGKTATATYDGKEHTVTGYEVTEISNNLYKASDIKFNGTAKASRTDVGTTNMGLKADQFENTNGNFKKVTFKVTDGSQTITAIDAEVVVTITGNTKTVTYNGEEQSVEGYTATITKDPSTLYTLDNIQLTGTAKASRTDVGTYDMGLKAEQFENTSKNFTNVTFVVAKDGWLKINPYMILIEPTETTFKYDGEEPKVKTDKIKISNENGEGLLLDHYVKSIETVGSGVDVGTYEWFSGHDAEIADGDDHDVTANYQISYAAQTMTITKRDVTLTSASDSKVYDGEPLIKHEVTVSGDGFVKDEGATYNVTGSQKDAGESENTFTYTLNEGTKADNYNITVVFGTLKVTPVTDKVTVTIAGHKKTVTYDGEKHEVTGYDVKNISNPLYTEADFEFIGTMTQDAYAPGVDAGEYPMGLKAEQFRNTSKNFTNVMFKVKNGQLTIDRYAILITPDDVTTEYSGKAPEVVKYTIDGEKPEGLLLDHQIASYETYGSGVDVGEYDQFSMNNATIVDGNGNDVTKNYDISYEESKLVITPASMKITTNSAEKTYDGSALTADGKIEGLVNGETVTFTVTGSQTEVGESQNTYEIKWDGSAKEANYKIAEEDVTIGTLKVNARSGGGSSSKPTPEDEPTPTPTPTPLPTLPTTPAPTTPTRRVTRSTATATQPASRPTEQITENETPKAESEPEVIEDEETPLAPMAGGAWALVNLILMLLTVLASLLLLLGYLGKKKYAKEDEYGNALHDANGNEIIDYTRNKKGFWRVASLIPAIAAVIAFALTENMRLPMVMTDRWTLLMVIIAVVQLIVAVLCKKKKESEEDENQANA